MSRFRIIDHHAAALDDMFGSTKCARRPLSLSKSKPRQMNFRCFDEQLHSSGTGIQARGRTLHSARKTCAKDGFGPVLARPTMPQPPFGPQPKRTISERKIADKKRCSDKVKTLTQHSDQ